MLTSMNSLRTGRTNPAFGAWLLGEIQAAGMSRAEFAKKVGVSHVTVGRWINGRVPDAGYIDPIADVLVLDYDKVATKAGYRPRLPMEGLDKFHALADPYARKLDWDDPEVQLAIVSALQQQIRVQEIRQGTRTVERYWEPVELDDEEE